MLRQCMLHSFIGVLLTLHTSPGLLRHPWCARLGWSAQQVIRTALQPRLALLPQGLRWAVWHAHHAIHVVRLSYIGYIRTFQNTLIRQGGTQYHRDTTIMSQYHGIAGHDIITTDSAIKAVLQRLLQSMSVAESKTMQVSCRTQVHYVSATSP